LVCDGKCEKAWGRNSRPEIQLDENDPDDTVYLADDELGTAPEDPGTYECDCPKPREASELLNKWCCRECERSSIIQHQLKDFSVRRYNKSSSEKREKAKLFAMKYGADPSKNLPKHVLFTSANGIEGIPFVIKDALNLGVPLAIREQEINYLAHIREYVNSNGIQLAVVVL
jgi:hypothetical protein